MRLYPRPGRVSQRLGNVLPDASGEIEVRGLQRAMTDNGMGVVRLGISTLVAEAVPFVTESAPQARE